MIQPDRNPDFMKPMIGLLNFGCGHSIRFLGCHGSRLRDHVSPQVGIPEAREVASVGHAHASREHGTLHLSPRFDIARRVLSTIG